MKVLTKERSKLRLDRTPVAPRAARRHVEDVVRRPSDVVAIADLLVTELVTNSVRHAGSGPDDHVEVRVDLDDRRLRIEVDDGGGGDGALRPPLRQREEGGFGLLFVDSLADRWGSERHAGGTTVWFELDLG